MNKILIKDCDKRDFNSYYFNTNNHFFGLGRTIAGC